MVQPGAAGTLVMRESKRRNASRTCMNVLWSRGVPLPSVEAVARLISDILVGGLASAAAHTVEPQHGGQQLPSATQSAKPKGCDACNFISRKPQQLGVGGRIATPQSSQDVTRATPSSVDTQTL